MRRGVQLMSPILAELQLKINFDYKVFVCT